jgi:hypothetical protein
MGLEDIPDTLSSKGLFPESGLDLVQNLLVAGLGLVEHCMSVVPPRPNSSYVPFLRAR